MHHLSVKSNLVDTNSDTKNVGSKGIDAPVCPKPRRLGSALPAQFLNRPLLCSNHPQINSVGTSGILNIIAEKRMDVGELGGGRRCSSATCEWSGSPPGRTDNPLVHDAQFLQIHHHMDVLPPFAPT